MAQDILLSRDEAEWLVDLLESEDPKNTGTWRFDLASEIRERFGMRSLAEENAERDKRGMPPKEYTQ